MLEYAKAAKQRGAEIIIYPEEVVFGRLNPRAFYEVDPIPGDYGSNGCNYAPGPLSDVRVVATPFGRIGMLVCADAYTSDTSTIDVLKSMNPELVIVPWGVTAASQEECGEAGFNATGFAAQAATHLGSAYVIGANSVGSRPYGRFLPSWYCGTSGFATPWGKIGGLADEKQGVTIFDVPLR